LLFSSLLFSRKISFFIYFRLKRYFLLQLCLFSGLVYGGLLLGWRGHNKYSLLGGLRACIQAFSFDFVIFILVLIFFIYRLSLGGNIFGVFYGQLFWLCPGVVVVLFFGVSFEINRSPFDFIEGESELVSGFNTEVGGGSFAYLFVGEYLLVLFFIVFFQLSIGERRKLFLFISFYFFLFLRCVYPRYRYDKLMYFVWKKLFFIVGFLLVLVCFI